METVKPTTPKSARERLLSAAGQLFYEEGINTVGIDRIIERAGVAKASLYDVFGSKEELIRSYLESRQEARQARMTEKLARYRTPREKILGVFDIMGELFAERELSRMRFHARECRSPRQPGRKGGPRRLAGVDARAFHATREGRGRGQPKKLARQLVLLYDGATVSAQMDRDPGAANAARAMAAALLDAAT